MNTYSSTFCEEKSSHFVRECRIRLFTEWFVKSYNGILGTDINRLRDHSYFTIILEILIIYRPNEDGVDEGLELLMMESENEEFQEPRWFFSRSEYTHRRIS